MYDTFTKYSLADRFSYPNRMSGLFSCQGILYDTFTKYSLADQFSYPNKMTSV